MLQPHVGHTATLLNDGRVLIAGGSNLAGEATSECELFDPKTNRWTRAASMHQARAEHTATLLGNGEVLVAGGQTALNTFPVDYLSGAEIYDPHANVWTEVNSMHTQRAWHSAVGLQDGRVLVVGGTVLPLPGAPLEVPDAERAEVYEVNPDRWLDVGTDLPALSTPAASLLPNGYVLVTGGANGDGFATSDAALFDPSQDAWHSTIWPSATPRFLHTATLLDDGKVLLMGGYTGRGPSQPLSVSNVILSSDLVDPGANTVVKVVSQNKVARIEHTATLLRNGMVLIVGSAYASNADSVLFDPQNTETLISTGMRMDRYLHTATLLKDGRVLIAGGYGVGSQRTAWIYSSAQASTAPLSQPPIPLVVAWLLALVLAVGLIPAFGRRLHQRNPATDESEWVEP
jgi:hypothetical protein